MSSHVTSGVVLLKTLTLLLGGLITLYSYRAYRRTGSAALRALTLGFGLVTVGSLLAGLVDQVFAFGPNLALVVEGLFTASGFAVILYSLFVE